MTLIHASALIDASAHVGSDVRIGPGVIVGPGVTVGDRCRLDARVVLEQNVILGDDCRVGVGSIIGGDPQDVTYAGEDTRVEIGPETTLREYVTVNRGTARSGATIIGRGCYLMTYVHVAHDCRLGDRVVIANAVQMAGHVEIGSDVTIGGLTPIHQFVRIGNVAFIGGGSRVNQDIPPYTKAVGNPLRLYGLNTVGLDRAGLDADTRFALKQAYRRVFNSDFTISEGIDQARREIPKTTEVEQFLTFIEESPRGVEA